MLSMSISVQPSIPNYLTKDSFVPAFLTGDWSRRFFFQFQVKFRQIVVKRAALCYTLDTSITSKRCLVRRSVVFALFSAVLGLVIIACQGVGGTTSKPVVIIASPPSGSLYTVGEKVVVQSTSTDPAGVVSVALLVDGAQVRQDPSPVTQGQAQFSLIQEWTADQPGQHTITVRATNTQGGTSESGILVNVREQTGVQPTLIIAIATAVPLATFTPTTPPTASPPTEIATNPAMTVVITATPPPATETAQPTAAPPCVNNSKFVADLTIPDGTIFTPNAVFNKSWRVLNNGGCSWENYSLVFVSGTQMAAGTVYPVPVTQPGATADLVVPMTAPAHYGSYTGTWRLRDPGGNLFGTNLTVVINVPSPATAVPPTNTPPPTTAGCSGQPNDFQFTASAANINAGQSVNLNWSAVTNASAVYLSGGDFGPEPGQGVETPGNRTIFPGGTTSYKLKAICSNSGQSRDKTVMVTVNAPVGNFAGTWDHNFGSMVLAQAGANVNGSYIRGYDGGNGTLEGTMSGNTLDGHWHSGGDTDTIHFVLGGNGNTFTGNWDGSNQWCGARTGEAFPGGCAYAGKWKTRYDNLPTTCDMNLTQKGTQITGTYCNGTITGTVSYVFPSVVLDGQWKFSPPGIEQGPFKFYLPLFSSSWFQGNYANGSNPWCGWRSNSSEPSPCQK